MESTAVKERSVIFSGPMVRAILEGRKTQTRRVVKPQSLFDGKDGIVRRFPNQRGCPYGETGDRLWVRETWAAFIPCGLQTRYYRTGVIKQVQVSEYHKVDREVVYSADGEDVTKPHQNNASGSWNSPVTMPRWASRLTLEITDVRVQRLSEISTDDVNAEGVACSDCWTSGTAYKDFPHNEQCGCVNKFRNLWNSENTESGDTWDANPWVFAITFKRC